MIYAYKCESLNCIRALGKKNWFNTLINKLPSTSKVLYIIFVAYRFLEIIAKKLIEVQNKIEI